MLTQQQINSIRCLENAHTAIHQAIDLLKKEGISSSKQKQAEALRMIANSLANL